MIDPNQIYGLASVPIIIALLTVVKRAWPRCPKHLVPLLDLVIGIGLNVFLAWYLKADMVLGGILGMLAGLMASGAYSGTKAAIEGLRGQG